MRVSLDIEMGNHRNRKRFQQLAPDLLDAYIHNLGSSPKGKKFALPKVTPKVHREQWAPPDFDLENDIPDWDANDFNLNLLFD